MAALIPGLMMATVVGFAGATASSLAKVCLDAVVQRDLPEVSRASAFGRSETALQLAWVFGGVVGLLLGGLLELSYAAIYTIGFATATVLLLLGLVQAWLVPSGRSLLTGRKPRRGRRPSRRGRASAAGDTTRFPTDGGPTASMTPPGQWAPPPGQGPDGQWAPSQGQGPAPGGQFAPPERGSAPAPDNGPQSGRSARRPGRQRLRYQKPADR